MDGDGKVAIVNGASRGIGKAIARALKVNGWTVYPTSKGGGDNTISCDHRVTFNIASVMDLVMKEHGRVDLLVNVAGVYKEDEILEEHQNELDHVLKTNVVGPWNWTRAVLPVMREQHSGYIVNVSSMAAKRVRPGCSTYAMSKAALNSLTEATLRENLQYGIRATAICPGDTDTTIGRKIVEDQAELLPVADIANTVIWLESLSETAIVPEICIERRGRWI